MSRSQIEAKRVWTQVVGLVVAAEVVVSEMAVEEDCIVVVVDVEDIVESADVVSVKRHVDFLFFFSL